MYEHYEHLLYISKIEKKEQFSEDILCLANIIYKIYFYFLEEKTCNTKSHLCY